MSLWQEWEALYTDLEQPALPRRRPEAFYHDHRAAMDAGAVLLWPEEEDLYTLMCMRAESGRTAFEREKQNSPVNPELCEWPETLLRRGDLVRALAAAPGGQDAGPGSEQGQRRAARRLLGAGDAGRGPAGACCTSRPTWPGGPRRRSWPTAWSSTAASGPTCSASRRTSSRTCWRAEFEAEFRRQGLLAAAALAAGEPHEQAGPHPPAGTVPGRRGGCDSNSNSPGTRLLVEQLQQFPVGDHDDGPDALEMAVRLAAELLAGRTHARRPGDRLPMD